MKKIFFLASLLFLNLNLIAQLNLNKGTILPRKYYQELQVEFVNNKLVMEAEIDGEKSKFILDTGAPLCITKEFQQKKQYKILFKDSIIDANGMSHFTEIVKVDKLKIGSLVFSNIPALVIDLKGSILECYGTNGLIGSNLLRFGAIQIDWKKQLVILTNSYKNLGLKKKDAEPLLVNEVQSSPYLSVKVGENITDRLLIDTGSGDFYSFTKVGLEFVQAKGHLKDAVIMESNGSSTIGLFGAYTQGSDKLVKIDSLTIGKMAHLHGFHTVTTNDDQSRIGVYLLKQGITTIDYLHELFFFQLYEDDFKYEYASFGFDLVYSQNKIIVGSVWRNSDADKKGLSVGDEFVALKGFNLDTKDFCQAFFDLKFFLTNLESIQLQYKKENSNEIKQIELNRMKL